MCDIWNTEKNLCQQWSQRWPALLRIMSALAERLQIRRSRGPTATEAVPGKERCTHIFEARSLQVVWPRSPQTGPRTLSKRKHFLDLKRQTPSLNTRNVRSRWYRGKHSNKLKPRRQTLRDNSGTNPSPHAGGAKTDPADLASYDNISAVCRFASARAQMATGTK